MLQATARVAVLAAVLLLGCSGGSSPQGAAGGGEREVVVYVSEDQVFSQPVLEAFERETGIRVRAVYDTEETKGTGVTNRLLAEREHPRADLYWANEPVRAELLAEKGVAEAYRSPSADGMLGDYHHPDWLWTGFSARMRVLVEHVEPGAEAGPAARSVRDLADPRWKGRVVLANPLFGTTTIHLAALFQRWGEERGRAFLDELRANGLRITASNGESAEQVAGGQAALSLVDSDDAVSRMRRGDPIRMVVPDQEEGGLGVFLVPNAVLLVRGGPHPEEARALADYLLSPEAEALLAREDCAQLPLHPGVEQPEGLPSLEGLRLMPVSYEEVARELEAIQPVLREWAAD